SAPAHHSRSASCARPPALACASQCHTAAWLVMVATLPPESCQLLPHETPSAGRGIAPDTHPTACSVISRASLLSKASVLGVSLSLLSQGYPWKCPCCPYTSASCFLRST